jgi:hypothetical protein
MCLRSYGDFIRLETTKKIITEHNQALITPKTEPRASPIQVSKVTITHPATWNINRFAGRYDICISYHKLPFVYTGSQLKSGNYYFKCRHFTRYTKSKCIRRNEINVKVLRKKVDTHTQSIYSWKIRNFTYRVNNPLSTLVFGSLHGQI